MAESDPDDAERDEELRERVEGNEELRRRVEDKYDFEDFGPADMAEMTVEEWEAAFDPDTWITGQRLLDRVQADLEDRVRRRELFAVVEREPDRVLAYSDVDYATVDLDGEVGGGGALQREVEPIVALCSMEDYDVPERSTGQLLPHPDEVPAGSGDLGNRVMQVVAGTLVLAGAFLVLSPLLVSLPGDGAVLLTTVAGLVFVIVGVVLFLLVANARLSDRFRAREYRERLRAAGVGSDERPDFLAVEDEEDDA